MLTAIGRATERWVANKDPWSNVLGVGRTLLAAATLSTLLFNRASVLIRPLAGILAAPVCTGARGASAYCLAGGTHLELIRWLSIAALVLVASGWRPRLTGVLHWWVTWSLQASAATLDGGDQISGILALLLIPVTLTDDRVWHWQTRTPAMGGERESVKRMFAATGLLLVRIQVAIVYLHAAVGKGYAHEWQDGTALYYWLQHPDFGAPAWLSPILRPVLVHATSVALLTWGVMLVELALAAGLFMDRRLWPALLVTGLLLHGGIILLHGLVSFCLIMMAALVLYLRPAEIPFRIAGRARRFADLFLRHRFRPTSALGAIASEVIGGE